MTEYKRCHEQPSFLIVHRQSKMGQSCRGVTPILNYERCCTRICYFTGYFPPASLPDLDNASFNFQVASSAVADPKHRHEEADSRQDAQRVGNEKFCHKHQDGLKQIEYQRIFAHRGQQGQPGAPNLAYPIENQNTEERQSCCVKRVWRRHGVWGKVPDRFEARPAHAHQPARQ